MTIKTKQTINDLKDFYIDHMIETYNNDWDKFWEDHEDIIELEYNLNNINKFANEVRIVFDNINEINNN